VLEVASVLKENAVGVQFLFVHSRLQFGSRIPASRDLGVHSRVEGLSASSLRSPLLA